MKKCSTPNCERQIEDHFLKCSMGCGYDFETMPIGTKERIKELERKLEVARAALRFYSSPLSVSYDRLSECFFEVIYTQEEGLQDREIGERARQCLKEIGE